MSYGTGPDQSGNYWGYAAFKGWAAGQGDVTHVYVIGIDQNTAAQVYQSEIPLGSPRPDIQAQFVTYPNAFQSGFAAGNGFGWRGTVPAVGPLPNHASYQVVAADRKGQRTVIGRWVVNY